MVPGFSLWNIFYKGLLNLDVPTGVQLDGFADDLKFLMVVRRSKALAGLVNLTLER